MAARRFTKQDKEEALKRLREWIKPGDTIHCILRSVARSGMSRRISLIHIDDKGVEIQLDWNVAALGIGSVDRDRDGIKIGGCGMDMGFALVHELSYALFKDGFGCIGEKCPSNDHSNGDRDRTPHADAQKAQASKNGLPVTTANVDTQPGHWHKSGGYALRHRWL